MSKVQFTTTLRAMLDVFQDSTHCFLCDLVLFMHDPSLRRLSDDSSICQFTVDVIDVFLKAFPTRISTSHGRIDPHILEWCVGEDYLDSSMMGVREFRNKLLDKLITEFGDVRLTFTITNFVEV